MKSLHPKQSKILELLKVNSSSPLTMKDLSSEVDIDSPGVLYHHLKQLEKKGYLKRNPNNSKDYIVLDTPDNNIVYIGKYGDAQCGPNGLMLDGNTQEHIPIASSLLRFPSSEAFIVVAKGDSMEPKISAGDIIIAKKQNSAEHGDIVVCTLNGNVIVKKYVSLGNHLSLVSLNQEKYHPITIGTDVDFSIAGVVKNILSYN